MHPHGQRHMRERLGVARDTGAECPRETKRI